MFFQHEKGDHVKNAKNHGRSYSNADREIMYGTFSTWRTIYKENIIYLAEKLGRTPYAIELQLEKWCQNHNHNITKIYESENIEEKISMRTNAINHADFSVTLEGHTESFRCCDLFFEQKSEKEKKMLAKVYENVDYVYGIRVDKNTKEDTLIDLIKCLNEERESIEAIDEMATVPDYATKRLDAISIAIDVVADQLNAR